MGLGLEFVISDESHYSEFLCKICLQLTENPVLTSCSHVFCSACLERWFGVDGSQHKCPACMMEISALGVRTLKETNPLAWRVLMRVRCKCPLFDNCGWNGEYSELLPHLVNSESHINRAMVEERTSNNAMNLAVMEGLKLQGNAKYEQGMFRDSITLYSKAIAVGGNEVPAQLYGNRAAAWLMVGAYRECVDDCELAISTDPTFAKAYVRRSKAYCNMGDFDQAVNGLEEAVKNGLVLDEIKFLWKKTKNVKECIEMGMHEFEAGRPERALSCLSTAKESYDIPVVQCLCGRCYLALGKCDQAIALMTSILRDDGNHVEALVIRAQALCWRGDFEASLVHFRKALQLDPDQVETQNCMKKAKIVSSGVTDAQQKMFRRLFEEAVGLWNSVVVTMDEWGGGRAPIMSVALAGRSTAQLRLGKLEEALADAERAIVIQYDCVEAYTTKASVLHKLERHDEAQKFLEEACEKGLASDTQIQGALERAKFEVRKSKRPNYYQILGVPSVASVLEIKNAYKKRALECHPDRAAGDDEKRAKHEEEFKLLGEALDILGSEPLMKRQLYDEGYDKEEIQQRVERAQRAARQNSHGYNAF